MFFRVFSFEVHNFSFDVDVCFENLYLPHGGKIQQK